jgi:hypothetical protein
MALQYRVVFLTPGQKAPVGSTGRALANGGIMWTGEEGTFNDAAITGTKLAGDITPDATYTHSLATQAEIDEYNTPEEAPEE